MGSVVGSHQPRDPGDVGGVDEELSDDALVLRRTGQLSALSLRGEPSMIS